jgi:hypothetical protein
MIVFQSSLMLMTVHFFSLASAINASLKLTGETSRRSQARARCAIMMLGHHQ